MEETKWVELIIGVIISLVGVGGVISLMLTQKKGKISYTRKAREHEFLKQNETRTVDKDDEPLKYSAVLVQQVFILSLLIAGGLALIKWALTGTVL